MTTPTCDMRRDCTESPTHIDNKGYIYCTPHGEQRSMGQPCRKLRPHELARINRGEPIAHY